MKKNPLVPILGGGVIAALVLGVMAVIVLVDAGLLHLLGVRCDSFLCTVFAFWVADMLMEPVEANLLAVLVVGLLSALFSRPVKQAVRRKKTPLEGEHDQANDDRLN